MKINLLVMIALTILLVVLTPLLVMGIINLGNNIKTDDDIKSETQLDPQKDQETESGLPSSTTTLILTYPSPIPTYTPLPTYTPVPTYTPLATYTPVPVYTPYPTPSPPLTPTPTGTPTPTNTPIPTSTPISAKATATTNFTNQRYAFTPLLGLCDFSSSLIPKLSSEELEFMNKNKLSEIVRFFPSKIFDDETTKIVSTGNIETFPVTLYDDGTHGDEMANDGLFSRACVSKTDLNITLTDFDNLAASYRFHDGVLRIVDSSLRGTVPVTTLSSDLMATENAMFMNLGTESYKKVRSGNTSDLQNPKTCETCEEVLNVFGDVLDHIILVPDEPTFNENTNEYTNYLRTSDSTKGIMTYGDPICDPTGWNNHGKSGGINKDYQDLRFGCPSKFLNGRDYPRLKGIIWAGGMEGLNAAFGHWVGIGPRNGNFPLNSSVSWNSIDRKNIDDSTTVKGPYPITGSLWDPERGKPHKVQVLSNNKWQDARIETNEDGGFSLTNLDTDHYKFDDIFLYMMGFISYENALSEKYYYLQELDLSNCTTGAQNLLCSAQDAVIEETQYKSAIEFTVKNMLSTYGARDPVYSEETTHLNAPAIVLSESVPSDASIVWHDLLFDWWGTKEGYMATYGGHTWKSVTKGKATISTGYR